MAARTKHIVLSEEWKEKIKIGVILDRLIQHVDGKIQMSSSQIKAADILLKKVAPDLSRSDVNNNHSGAVEVKGNVSFVGARNRIPS